MILFLVCFSAGASFLLSFLLFFHPLQQNMRANKWLGLFVFTLGLAFFNIYLRNNQLEGAHVYLSAWVGTLQLTSAPLLYLGIQFFIHPSRNFKPKDILHFIPSACYLLLRFQFIISNENSENYGLWRINNLPVESYFLPVQIMAYTVISYRNLVRHRANLKLISSAINEIDLEWLKNFLLILILDLLLWINEVFFNITFLIKLDPFIYTGSIYFLAYFSIRQKSIFTYKRQDMQEISAVFNEVDKNENSKQKRLSDGQLAKLKIQLDILIAKEKIFLDNELNLAQVAQKLGIGIHDASFFINEVTGENFYNLINKHRVDEAKRLLTSSKSDTLNMLGIAFAAGFNSKTTFNTTFKKITGVSPSQFAKNQEKKPDKPVRTDKTEHS